MRLIEVYKAESKMVKEIVKQPLGSPVEFREESVRKTVMIPQFAGIFHQWIVLSSEYLEGALALFAVIEKEDGSVVHVDSTLVKFIINQSEGEQNEIN